MDARYRAAHPSAASTQKMLKRRTKGGVMRKNKFKHANGEIAMSILVILAVLILGLSFGIAGARPPTVPVHGRSDLPSILWRSRRYATTASRAASGGTGLGRDCYYGWLHPDEPSCC